VPRRTSNGIDSNRLLLVTAVLSKRLNVGLYDQDVYVNVVGGLRVEEPSADLAAALAIISSVRDHAVPGELVALGEIGLSGELRGVGQVEHRLREAAKLGFVTALVPGLAARHVSRDLSGINVTPVTTLRDAIRVLGL